VTESAHSTSKPRGPAALATSAPSDGALRRGLSLSVTLVAGIAAWHAFATSPQHLIYPDTFDYAQMGRQLSRGEGMTSLQVFPYSLGWLDAQGQETAAPWPNIWRFPLPVIVRAVSFSVLGESDVAALVPALLFSVLTATLLFALANRLGGPVAGLLAAAIWISSASQRTLAVTGLSEPGAALLAVAIALLAVRARDRASPVTAATLGATLGLALLHRSNLLALAPVAIWMVWSADTERRPARVAALVLATAAIAAPWWLRNWIQLGEPLLNLTTDRGLHRLALGADPFFTLGGHATGPTLLRESLGQYPGGWSWEWLRGAWTLMLGRDFAWLFVASAVLLPLDVARRRAAAPLWAMAFGGLTLTALVFAPIYSHVVRFYWPYAPLLLALVCSSALAALLDRTRARWPAAAPGFAIAGLVLFLAAAPRANVSPVMPAAQPEVDLGALADAIPAGAIVASDISYAMAWQIEHPSVRINGNYDVVAEINARIQPVGAIHIGLERRLAQPLNEPPLSKIFQLVVDDAQAGLLYVRSRSDAPATRIPTR